MTRTIILAGAPESNSLNWNEKSLLPTQHIENASPATSDVSTKPEIPKWRKLEMERLKMRPILTKLDLSSPNKDLDMAAPATFLDTTELLSQDSVQESVGSDVSADESRPSTESYEPETEALSEFYDHSLDIHEAMPTSQISESVPYTPGTPVYESSDEMFPEQPTTPGGIMRTSSQRRLSQAPKPKQLTHLCEIPGASFLKAISPQTKTVNLIVGVISIGPSKLVTAGAKWNNPKPKELIEILVGDDTKTGFSIAMWLPREMRVNWRDGAQERPEGSRSTLRRSLKAIRPRDVVLIQNVALSEFRGKVHGASLRHDVTKIDTLFRKRLDDEEQVGCYTAQNLRMSTGRDPQIAKVKRVRDWMADFLGDVPDSVASKKKLKKVRTFPDNTPSHWVS